MSGGGGGDERAQKRAAKTPFERVGWPIIALLVPIVVTTITAHTYNVKSERDARLRLYSQLISQRENSESALRIDMLNTLVGKFFDSKAIYGKETTVEDIDAVVLQLELITYNFHESLQLSPLFHAANRQVVALRNQENDPEKLAEIAATNARLLKLARKVIRKQVETLENYGDVDDYELSMSGIQAGYRKFGLMEAFENLIDGTNARLGRQKLDRGLARKAWNSETKQIVVNLLNENVLPRQRDMIFSVLDYAEYDTVTWAALFDTVRIAVAESDTSQVIDVIDAVIVSADSMDSTEVVRVGPYQIDHTISLKFAAGDSVHYMRSTLEIMDVDEENHEIQLRLGTVECAHPAREEDPDHSTCPVPPLNLEHRSDFHVGVFDFPLIDNTRLAGDRRFSVFIKRWNDDDDPVIELGFTLFPGYVASLREKSYFKDVMERLRID